MTERSLSEALDNQVGNIHDTGRMAELKLANGEKISELQFRLVSKEPYVYEVIRNCIRFYDGMAIVNPSRRRQRLTLTIGDFAENDRASIDGKAKPHVKLGIGDRAYTVAKDLPYRFIPVEQIAELVSVDRVLVNNDRASHYPVYAALRY